MSSPIINLSALEPLYLPHEMPTHHRVRAEKEGYPAKKVKGRRTSDIIIAQNLRRYVTEWRETDYFFEKKEGMSFAPVFTPLLGPLDESAKGLINELLLPLMPSRPAEQKAFFEPYYGTLKKSAIEWLNRHASNLRRTLVFKNGLWPSGLLLFCLDYCRMSKYELGGVFEAIRKSFAKFNGTDLFDTVKAITDFRNNYIAHQEKELIDINIAREGLIAWVMGIYKIYFTHH